MRIFERTLHQSLVLAALAWTLGGNAAWGQSQQSNCPRPTANETTPSVAAAARAAKARRGQAQQVFTDEVMETRKGPLPRLSMEGVDNSDEIIAAIGKYKEKHSPEEVEQAVHDWYDEYDTELNAAITQVNDFRNLRDANVLNGYELCQQSADYEKCERRRQAEMRGARLDNQIIRDNGLHTARIQQAMIKVRGGIMRYNLNYSWFKIRQGNGNGSF
jgi:hypothetical protein